MVNHPIFRHPGLGCGLNRHFCSGSVALFAMAGVATFYSMLGWLWILPLNIHCHSRRSFFWVEVELQILMQHSGGPKSIPEKYRGRWLGEKMRKHMFAGLCFHSELSGIPFCSTASRALVMVPTANWCLTSSGSMEAAESLLLSNDCLSPSEVLHLSTVWDRFGFVQQIQQR